MSFDRWMLYMGMVAGSITIFQGFFGGHEAAVGVLLVIYCSRELQSLVLAERMNRLIRDNEVDLYRLEVGEE